MECPSCHVEMIPGQFSIHGSDVDYFAGVTTRFNGYFASFKERREEDLVVKQHGRGYAFFCDGCKCTVILQNKHECCWSPTCIRLTSSAVLRSSVALTLGH